MSKLDLDRKTLNEQKAEDINYTEVAMTSSRSFAKTSNNETHLQNLKNLSSSRTLINKTIQFTDDNAV